MPRDPSFLPQTMIEHSAMYEKLVQIVEPPRPEYGDSYRAWRCAGIA
jgi:hypothetical protein